ncbi:IclR family transcriptional regulator [Gordonia polyisoprenivorans]|uniref:IclR family transcriptional regulator n=1 Tax=Gordonia polyisoprenivorans TaxID=84595 RepID=UPI000B99E1FD|nr:IclR family transcriptional regulator [Gordonia polyisoprenivorans]OZC29385.1 IclR family transcriptional regulator [Gordonia polyisoprenivorans]QUD81454.1 IclR family transcriptional regulator [Gordonia polyisoprenivorans]
MAAMTEERSGVVGRAAALLRVIGAHEPDGVTTTVAARHASTARPTAHRLLCALQTEGLVDRDRAGRWTLGPEIYLLGASAATRYDITADSADLLDALARESGESAFLSARRGEETVCIASREGSFPLRSHVLHEGIRFPLGVASAGLAILSHLPDHDIDDYLRRTDLTDTWGPAHSAPALRARIAATRNTGYAVNPALLVEGSWGIGAAVFDHTGTPCWALSVTGVETRFGDARQKAMGALLLKHAHILSQRLKR